MLAFLTKEIELKKNYDIVYIFNNEKLFNKLKDKFSCVNLAKDGNIKNINFAQKIDLELYEIIDIQKAAYFYLKKKRSIGLRGRDFNMKMLYEIENNRQYKEAIVFMRNTNLELLDDIISMNIDAEFSKNYRKFLDITFNYITSFYYAYAYKFAYNERIEIFRFALFLNVLLYYRFDKWDVNEYSFKRGYLKVLSRLFVEQIHRRGLAW